MHTPQKNSPHGLKGQGLVEFALVLPLVLVLVLGIIEISRLLFLYAVTTSASREGARYGAVAGDGPSGTPQYLDCDGIRGAAQNAGILANIQTGNVTIVYDGGFTGSSPNPVAPTPTPYSACPASVSAIQTGDRIVVDVSTNYSPIIPLPLIPSFQIRSITARSIASVPTCRADNTTRSRCTYLS